MTPCPSCQTPNPPAHAFCQQCGRPLRPGPPQNATVRWDGATPAGEVGERVHSIAALFAARSRLIVGRADDSDLRLEHPSVSRHHAALELKPDGLWLTDLGSLNGLVRGARRDPGPVRLAAGERVGVGPFLLSAADGELHVLDGGRRMRLVAQGLEKAVAVAGGKVRKLLEHVSLAVEPGEFVCLLGPSGSGKSTLMDCLNGRRRATAGQVLANGADFYRHFDSFRQSLGYVPQKDIVHTQLSVERALTYTARLRLPPDTGPGELCQRVEEVLALMELVPHRRTLVGQLSGGQIKRVSLGAELLGGPCLLYIDEATSGLDAGTEARMMRLFRQLADQGKTVLCITHALDNVEQCHLTVVLMRGRLVYFGPPGEAPAYFGVPRLGDVYDRLAEREPEAWEDAFLGSDVYREYVKGRVEEVEEAPQAPALQRGTLDTPFLPDPRGQWHQFRVLTRRYLDLVAGDRRSLVLLVLQAPVVGAILLLGFANMPYAQKTLAPRRLTPPEREFAQWLAEQMPPGRAADLLGGVATMDGPVWPDRLIVDPRYTYMLLFIVAIAVLWFGCSNAAKEIVKEEAIYSRERAVNLGILPYLASKFLVLGAITAFQSLLMMAVIYGTLDALHAAFGHDTPAGPYQLPYGAMFGVLTMLSITGVAVGLLLSALVTSPDRANALLPYVLIPQIILGGGILTVKEGPLYWIALVGSPVYWAFRGLRTGETELPPDLSVRMEYDDSLWIPCLALGAQTAALLLCSALALKGKDLRRE